MRGEIDAQVTCVKFLTPWYLTIFTFRIQPRWFYLDGFWLGCNEDSEHGLHVATLDLIQKVVKPWHPLLPVVELGARSNVIRLATHLFTLSEHLWSTVKTLTMCSVRFRLYWSESGIVLKWISRESNSMTTLSSNKIKDQRVRKLLSR